MNHMSDTLFATVNRWSERLGPLTGMIDALIDRIAPQVTAQALSYLNCPAGGFVVCSAGCDYSQCCANCQGDAQYWVIAEIANNYGECGAGLLRVCKYQCVYC